MTDNLWNKIAANFAELDERERRVFKDVFGVELIKLPTLEEAGVALDVACQKIREFEERARRRSPPG